VAPPSVSQQDIAWECEQRSVRRDVGARRGTQDAGHRTQDTPSGKCLGAILALEWSVILVYRVSGVIACFASRDHARLRWCRLRYSMRLYV
jgi:hypothetical protein